MKTEQFNDIIESQQKTVYGYSHHQSCGVFFVSGLWNFRGVK